MICVPHTVLKIRYFSFYSIEHSMRTLMKLSSLIIWRMLIGGDAEAFHRLGFQLFETCNVMYECSSLVMHYVTEGDDRKELYNVS
jgi:hypothetical protein